MTTVADRGLVNNNTQSPPPTGAPPPPPQAPLVTIPSQLSSAASAKLNQYHMQLGDYGEIYVNSMQTPLLARITAASAEAIQVTYDKGNSSVVPWWDISLFVRDDAKSRLAVSAKPGEQGPPAPLRQIEILELIGQGAQGRVSKARYSDAPPTSFIVVKEAVFPGKPKNADEAEAKAKDIMNLRHEHLVQYLEVRRKDQTTVWIVMPFYEEKDMLNFIASLSAPLSEYDLCSMVLQLAKALNFLHQSRPPRVHRDVKLENVLMFDGGKRTLLVDLDLSRAMPQGPMTAVTRCGTFEYMAPEVETGHITPATDVWALGIILFILLAMPDSLLLPHPITGEKVPFNTAVWDQETLWKTLRTYIANSSKRRRITYNAELTELTIGMMSRDQTKRPSAQTIVDTLQRVMVNSLLAAGQ